MAYVAKLDENNTVTEVIAVHNDYEPNVVQFAIDLFGGTWIQTSYNGTIRKNFAGIGMQYDSIRDAFIYPRCHEEATLDEETCLWVCTNTSHIAEEVTNV
jgi:hypothetical protein